MTVEPLVILEELRITAHAQNQTGILTFHKVNDTAGTSLIFHFFNITPPQNIAPNHLFFFLK